MLNFIVLGLIPGTNISLGFWTILSLFAICGVMAFKHKIQLKYLKVIKQLKSKIIRQTIA